jgi:hypothetical protein
MWTRIVSLSAGFAVALYGAALVAQPPAAQPPTCSKAGPGSLWTSTPWLRLEIIGGRIAVASSRCGSHRLTAEPENGGAARQSLLVQMGPTVLTAQYEQLDEHSELTLDVDERGRLTICRRSEGDSTGTEVRYVQPATGEVTLSIGAQRPREYKAASLWHLLLTEQDASREHLLPLLARLRPDWPAGEALTQIEAALVERAGEDPLPLRRQWQTWIDELASESFARRQAADRALRAGGQPVLGFLREQSSAGLDPEQRRRIAGILSAAAASGADSPCRVADWLIADKRVWLSLMSRGELDQRIAAAQHLTKLCGRSLAYDPEASADLRQAQLADLQARLAEK